jgi:hypothetical protein
LQSVPDPSQPVPAPSAPAPDPGNWWTTTLKGVGDDSEAASTLLGIAAIAGLAAGGPDAVAAAAVLSSLAADADVINALAKSGLALTSASPSERANLVWKVFLDLVDIHISKVVDAQRAPAVLKAVLGAIQTVVVTLAGVSPTSKAPSPLLPYVSPYIEIPKSVWDKGQAAVLKWELSQL